MTKIRIVTHSGGFHTDDVFGVATLVLLLGKENVEILRSRDPQVRATGDYVLDVGEVSDPETNRFDHHQKGGAGEHTDGIPYASFGLIWRKFGEKVCGSASIARTLETELVEPIDGYDNGITFFESNHPSKIQPVILQQVIASFGPARGEGFTNDEGFIRAVEFAVGFLRRRILFAQEGEASAELIRKAYENASDKRLIVVETEPPISRGLIADVLEDYLDTVYFIKRHDDGNWQAICVPHPDDLFRQRKPFPQEWAGLSGEALVAVTGVADAIFCHNKRFMIVAESKESAIKLAEMALAASD